MKKIKSIIIGILLIVSILAVINPVSAATREVGPGKTYATINLALAAAGNGDTILVYPGTYNENIIIGRNAVRLTLKGAQAGVSPAKADVDPAVGRSGGESIIRGNIRIDNWTIVPENIIIDGFTLTNPGMKDDIIHLEQGSENITITNNIIYDGSFYGIQAEGSGLSGMGPAPNNIVISNNLFEKIYLVGIAMHDCSNNFTISGNLFRNFTGWDAGANNPLHPHPWILPSYTNMCTAIMIGGAGGPVKDINIENNIISTNQTGDGDATVAGIGILFFAMPDYGPTPPTPPQIESITINNNIIIDNSMGIASLFGVDGSGQPCVAKFNNMPQIHYNQIHGNTLYEIINEGNEYMDARHNMWGSGKIVGKVYLINDIPINAIISIIKTNFKKNHD